MMAASCLRSADLKSMKGYSAIAWAGSLETTIGQYFIAGKYIYYLFLGVTYQMTVYR